MTCRVHPEGTSYPHCSGCEENYQKQYGSIPGTPKNVAEHGAFCTTADAIVPLYAPEFVCDWCGSRHHFIRYVWNADTRQWDNINTDPGYRAVMDKEIEKPENYRD